MAGVLKLIFVVLIVFVHGQGDLVQLAKSTQEYSVTNFRYMHMYPEISWKEEKTLKYIETQIRTIIKDSVINASQFDTSNLVDTDLRGGIWVDINFDPSFDRILFRADVDALPIQEATELPYRSKIPGVMHSCGHDMHAAMLLSAFKAIATAKDAQWKNNLRFLFQRAEEFGRVSGAEKLVKTTKLLEGVNRAYAIHVSNTKPAGQFASCPGPILGSTDSFTVKIQSTGGHAGIPNHGTNALRVAAAIQNSLNTLPIRYLPTNEHWTLEPTIMKAGTTINIMPNTAEISYVARSLLHGPAKEQYFEAIKQEISRVCAIYNKKDEPETKCEVIFDYGYPVTVNDEKQYKFVKQLLEEDNMETFEIKPFLAGEDFSFILEKVPGIMWFLAVGGRGGGNHTPTFVLGEDEMWRGVFMYLKLAATKYNPK